MLGGEKLVRKLTYDYVKNFIEVDSDSKCILISEEYLSVDEKLDIMCPCGELFSTTFYNFQKKNKVTCNNCTRKRVSINNKLDFNKVKADIETISGYELVSENYMSATSKLIIKCPEGHLFHKSYSCFMQGQLCTVCSNIRQSEMFKTDINEIIKTLEQNNYKLIKIIGEYNGRRNTKALVRCNKGHEYVRFLDTLISNGGKGCKICASIKLSEDRRTPITVIYEDIENNNHTFVKWIDEYKNNTTPFILICPRDHTFKSNWFVFSRGDRCPYCYREDTRSENHPKWKGGISELKDYIRGRLGNWKTESLKKYEYKCAITGQKGFLEIHHVIPFHQFY